MPRRSRPTPPSRSIRKEDFADREDEAVLLVPKAGEMLFHLKKQPKWAGGEQAVNLPDQNSSFQIRHPLQRFLRMNATVVESATRLPVAERFQLLDSIWESIAKDLENEPTPARLLDELDRRDAAYEANPGVGVTPEQLEQQLFPKD